MVGLVLIHFMLLFGSFDNVNRLCAETRDSIDDYVLVKQVNTARNNVQRTLKDAESMLQIPSKVAIFLFLPLCFRAFTFAFSLKLSKAHCKMKIIFYNCMVPFENWNLNEIKWEFWNWICSEIFSRRFCCKLEINTESFMHWKRHFVKVIDFIGCFFCWIFFFFWNSGIVVWSIWTIVVESCGQLYSLCTRSSKYFSESKMIYEKNEKVSFWKHI